VPFVDLNELVESYVTWMEVKVPGHRQAFVRRLKHEPEAAHAEAVMFSILRAAALNPTPGEDVSTGGYRLPVQADRSPTFCRRSYGDPHRDRLEDIGTATRGTRKSGFRGFSQITRGLLNEAINKADQLANYPMARVLVIATEHPDASLLMGAHSATELLAGTTAISVRVGDIAVGETQIVATLRNSVFFRLTQDGTQVEPARQSISAILLVTIGRGGASMIGLLHPAAAHAFDHTCLPKVHFVRLTDWPITDNKLRMEWMGPAPDPTSIYHSRIQFTDEELRHPQ
jgi:hypothetical protein